MNRFFLKVLLLLSIGFTGHIFADGNFFPALNEKSIKARVAAFFPTSNRFRKIYDHTLPCYQLEVSGQCYQCLNIWANVDWIGKNGQSDRLNYFTSIKMLTYSGGLSVNYRLNDQLKVYLGIGPCGAYTQIHNRHIHEDRNYTKNSIGFLAKSGIIYDIDCHLFVDFFCDYFYQPKLFKTHVELSGIKTGAGIGYKF